MTAQPVRPLFPLREASGIVGESEALTQALIQVERVARSELPLLLVGATGTGKELFARYFHALTARPGPLVDIDCGAIPREMMESLLFGHRQGAFTGAVKDAIGLLAQASRGTLFLDELSSLSAEAQVKLLRVLETRTFRPLGQTGNVAVDLRLVSAVQDDLGRRIEAGTFRQDLYYRVAGAVIYLPPLCARGGDVLILASRFAEARGRKLGSSAAAVLQAYGWPGNIRELRSVIDRAAMTSDRVELDGVCLAAAVTSGSSFEPRRSVEGNATAEATDLLAVCAAERGDAQRIAMVLGVSRATVYRRLQAHRISLRRFGKVKTDHE